MPNANFSSVQWRAYLEIFEADEFRWNVFEGRAVAERRWTITGIHVLTTHRYPVVGDDLLRQLTEFTGFARIYLPERIGEPKAAPQQASFVDLSDRPGGLARLGSSAAPVSLRQ